MLNLMTFKFAVGTILCVVLMAVFMPVLVNDYQQRLKNYNANVAANEAELRKVRVYKNITPTVYRRPAVLSVFSEGVEKRLGNSAKIALEYVPEISYNVEGSNSYLSIFPTFDVSLILRIVLSILALLIAYDVISGEREQGTLKLIMSNTIARYQVLLGKILAGQMVLIVSLTAAFIIGLVILLSFSMVDLSSSEWIRISLIYVVSLIFISAMYNIGLLFSCLARRSDISLVLGLFLWIVFIIVIPNGSIHLSQQLLPLKSEGKLENELNVVREKRSSELKKVQNQIPSGWAESTGRGAFNGQYPFVCDSRGVEHYNKRFMLEEPIRIKYADKLWEVEHSYLRSLFKQNYLANNISRISPISAYKNVMSALAGTDLSNSQYFMDKVKTHRNKVIDYIRSNTDNFHSISYFMHTNEKDWEEQNKIFQPGIHTQNEAERQRVWKAFTEWKEKKIAATPPLNLEDLPRFMYQADIIKSIQRAIPDLGLLLFTNVLFFALSFAAFVRYDVRSG